MFLRAIPENIDRRQILTENNDGGQYSKVLPKINSYYMDYYPGLLAATLLNRKELNIKSNTHRNQSNPL